MYIPASFREDRPEVLHEIMRRHSFATLVSHAADGSLFASHLPFLFDAERNTLRSHMARANPQWQGFDGSNARIYLSGSGNSGRPFHLTAFDFNYGADSDRRQRNFGIGIRAAD